MKIFSLFVLILLTSAAFAQTEKWQDNVGAKTFPSQTEEFIVKNTRIAEHTQLIQQAIDKCAEAGGGKVIMEPGTYLTGSVFVKENVNLVISEGVLIKGIQREDVYPIIETRVAGIELEWPAAIINIIDVENAAVSGSGIINGQGKYFWDKFWNAFPEYDQTGLRWALDYDIQRPRGILVQNSKQVTLKDFTIQEPGFWTVHILYSNNVTVDGITIQNNIKEHGPSSDGIDIDSSKDILVQNCDIDCNDDNFCLKAGKDADGLRVNRPCENIIIRDCVSRAGHGLITFGSETSGGIRNLEAYNLTAQGTLYGIRLKSAKTRGGVIENVYIHDIEMDDVFVPIRGTLNWFPKYSYSKLPDWVEEVPEHWKVLSQKVKKKKGIPKFKNFHIKNLVATHSGSAIELEGLDNSSLENFVIEDTQIDCKRPGYIRYAENWKFIDVEINALSNEAVTEEYSSGIEWIYNK